MLLLLRQLSSSYVSARTSDPASILLLSSPPPLLPLLLELYASSPLLRMERGQDSGHWHLITPNIKVAQGARAKSANGDRAGGLLEPSPCRASRGRPTPPNFPIPIPILAVLPLCGNQSSELGTWDTTSPTSKPMFTIFLAWKACFNFGRKA